MATLTYTSKLNIVTCCNCGMTFGVEKEWDEDRRKDHGTFFCPAGHRQHYTGKTEEQKLREEARRLRDENARAWSAAQSARADRDYQKNRASAYKGHLTRTKKRVANGICPCCNRHFANLHAHMESQHPDYVDADGEADG